LPAHGISREVEAGTLALIRITEGHHVTLPTSVMVRRARIYSPAVLAFLSVLSRMYEVAVPPLETLDVIKADKKAPAV